MRFEVKVTPAMVDAETNRRITEHADPFDQMNAMRGARNDVDFAWIDTVREAGRKLKATPPIPPDYADDHHWPENKK